ncbi:MAG TPA: threonine synthase [Balneolaceae bacterium]|nr:threonine synthase [Balneolaceae bacterium]
MEHTNTGYELRCVANDHLNSEKETTTYCTECGSVLSVRYNETSPNIQYPLEHIVPDPLKTHNTALVNLDRLSKEYGADLWAKLEFEHPTACFKDRGSYIEVQKALELNADAICLASTGNMAASVAAYACYFKIPCFVFVPEKTTEAKLAQATIYDANIIRIKGSFSTCEALCREFAKSGNYYLAGDFVFREEGQKSFSYELIEQGGDDFDYIFIPIGCGTNFGAIYKGFKEMKDAGSIDKIPHLIATQPDQCSPVVEGIFKREKIVKKQVQTMASSVAVPDPVDFYKVLKGIDQTGGKAFTVTENQILDALKELADIEGHFAEPAGAIPLASFKKHKEEFKNKKCLLVVTGSGLKDTKTVTKHSLNSPVLSADIDKVINYVNSGFIEMQKDAWGKSRDAVVSNLKMDKGHQQLYDEYINTINKKGKTLTNNEMEVLQSMVFNEDIDLDYPVEVLDYKLTMRKHGLVHAAVKLKIQDKEPITEAKGVGPIDAILTAIKNETDNVFALDVKDHEVEILSPDTNSLVMVTLTLANQQQEWVSKAASPDTMEAVVQSFTKGMAVAMKGAET